MERGTVPCGEAGASLGRLPRVTGTASSAQRVATVPSSRPRGRFETASRQPSSVLAVQRRGSRVTRLLPYRHRTRRARRQAGRPPLRPRRGAVILHEAPRDERKDVATPQSQPPLVEGSGVVAMPDEDSDEGVLLVGSLAFAYALGGHPLSFLNDLSRPSTPSNPRSFGPSCRFAAARTTPLIGVPLRVFALRWRGRPGRL